MSIPPKLESWLRLLRLARSSPSQAFFGLAGGVTASGIIVLLTTQLDTLRTALVAGGTLIGFLATLWFTFMLLSEQKEVARIEEAIVDELEEIIEDAEGPHNSLEVD